MNAVDILKYGHLTVLQTLDGFPESAWDTPGACGTWSVKDIIAHLASHELLLVDVLTTFSGGGPTPVLNRFFELRGQFNDGEVSSRKEQTIKEVVAEYNDAHAQVMSMLARAAFLGRKRPVKMEPSRRTGRSMLWMNDFLVYASYGHKREHSAQIAASRSLATGYRE